MLNDGGKTFRVVREITGSTDGNLSVQISKPEECGNIEVHKDFFNNRPRARYNLTEKGRNEFIDYVNTLDNILRQYGKK